MVTPALLSSAITSKSDSASVFESAEVGSSRIRIFAFCSSARASSTIWRLPSDSLPASVRTSIGLRRCCNASEARISSRDRCTSATARVARVRQRYCQPDRDSAAPRVPGARSQCPGGLPLAEIAPDLHTLKEETALILLLHSGKNSHQRGLPGPVFPDQNIYLVAINSKIDSIQRDRSRVSPGNRMRFEDDVTWRSFTSRSSLRSARLQPRVSIRRTGPCAHLPSFEARTDPHSAR